MKKRAFAVAAHPDDAEFTMAGTLLLLKDAGYEIHLMHIANGSCGSLELPPEEMPCPSTLPLTPPPALTAHGNFLAVKQLTALVENGFLIIRQQNLISEYRPCYLLSAHTEFAGCFSWP